MMFVPTEYQSQSNYPVCTDLSRYRNFLLVDSYFTKDNFMIAVFYHPAYFADGKLQYACVMRCKLAFSVVLPPVGSYVLCHVIEKGDKAFVCSIALEDTI